MKPAMYIGKYSMIYNGIKVILKRFVVCKLSNLKMVGLEARKVNILII